MPDPIHLLHEGAVATLLIDRPSRRNAMDRAMWRAVPGLVARAVADRDVAVLCVAGAGGHFCGGADIAEFADCYATPEATTATNGLIRDAVEALAGCPKPTFAIVEGACVGGGVALALACDVRLASDDARFAVTPVKLGLIYSHADTRRLVRAIGVGRAKELMFSARPVAAEEALRIGLVERLWPKAIFARESQAYVQALAAGSRPALRGLKAMADAIPNGARHDAGESHLRNSPLPPTRVDGLLFSPPLRRNPGHVAHAGALGAAGPALRQRAAA